MACGFTILIAVPVVVLLHGNAVTLQDFEASGVLGLAAEHHRVLAFDRPGFGYSSRPRSTIWTPAAQAKVIASALIQLGI
jgi:pimeloyl-ACP methyl ester carboxylesterase